MSLSTQIPPLLWNPTVYHHIYKIPPPHPSMPRSFKCSASLKLPCQNTVFTPLLPHTCNMCSSSRSCFDQPNNIWWGYKSCSVLLCSILHSHVTSSPLTPKHLPQLPIHEHPQPVFLPQCERPSFTPMLGLKCLINPKKEDNLRFVCTYICSVISFVTLDLCLQWMETSTVGYNSIMWLCAVCYYCSGNSFVTVGLYLQ
jgi:hypothetical protein